MHATTHLGWSENNSWKLVLSFRSVGPRDRTQITGFGSRCLILLAAIFPCPANIKAPCRNRLFTHVQLMALYFMNMTLSVHELLTKLTRSLSSTHWNFGRSWFLTFFRCTYLFKGNPCCVTYLEIRSQLLGISSLLPPCKSQGSDMSWQVWQHMPLPTKLSQLPKPWFFNSKVTDCNIRTDYNIRTTLVWDLASGEGLITCVVARNIWNFFELSVSVAVKPKLF